MTMETRDRKRLCLFNGYHLNCLPQINNNASYMKQKKKKAPTLQNV